MGTENEERNAAEQPENVSAAAAPPPSAPRANRSFAERMGEAGYVTGRRYDAVKNEFLAYKTKEKKPKNVRARITRSGETFRSGRQVLAKLCLVGGYLRLFLALDPKQYNEDKYHHKDYTEVVRYAKFPFMIKLSSDRQVRYARELIGELLLLNGFVRDEEYVEKDQANIFKKPYRRKAAQPAEAEPSIVYVPVAREDDDDEIAAEEDIGEPECIDVKLPRRAVVVNKQRERIGKVRGGVWEDEEGNEQGVFVKNETNVFVYSNNERIGYVDKNDNILSPANKYIATLRRAGRFWLLLLLLLLLLLTVVSVALSAYFLTRSDNTDYAPVIFVATDDGTSWEDTENLPVFFSEEFGDAKAMPGMSGSYRFVFENRNDDAVGYSLGFSETNEYGISILYRLKRDGAYISGTEGYVTPEQLSMEGLTIEARSSSVFELEWTWKDNDAADTQAGENEAVYTLSISFSAQVEQRQ